MARPSNEFLMAWSSLTGADLEQGWQAISLPSAGALQLQAGRRSPDNAEAVLVGFPTARLAAAGKLPDGQGFAVERVAPSGDGWLWLALTRKPAGNAELFAAMSCDVVGALDDTVAAGADEAKLLRVFIARVGTQGRFRPNGRCNPRRMVHFPNGHCAAPQIESGHRARRSFRCRAKTQWARPGHKVGTKWAQDGHKAKRRPFGAAYIQF